MKYHLQDKSNQGITLVEVVLAISLVTVFCASALSAFLMNQAYSSLSIFNSQADRINRDIAETVLNTNYSGLQTFSVTNYDFNLSRRDDGPEFNGQNNDSGVFKIFRTRLEGEEWRTNLVATVAFESMVNIKDLGIYREAEIRTFWFFNGKYMTNNLKVARADDR